MAAQRLKILVQVMVVVIAFVFLYVIVVFAVTFLVISLLRCRPLYRHRLCRRRRFDRCQKCRSDYYETPANGKRTVNGNTLGDTVVYSCKTGYTLFGTSVLTCSGIQRVCANPGDPRNGRTSGDDFEVGQRVRFRCNPGYVLHGRSSATCRRNLRWSHSPPQCKVIGCASPKLPQNAVIRRNKKDSYTYGDRVYLACSRGYGAFGSSYIDCLGNGWSRAKLQCRPKSCGSPGQLTNGRVIASYYTYGNEITYESKLCGASPHLQNGQFEGFSTAYGAKKSARCKDGYMVQGSSQIICNGDNWEYDGAISKCVVITCNSFVIADGKVIPDKQGSFLPGERASVDCDDGYVINGRRSLECKGDGRWSHDQPVCLQKTCIKPREPRNGRIIEKVYYIGDKAEIVCSKGYYLNGENQKCGQHGWIGSAPTCKVKSCPYPESILNGYVTRKDLTYGGKVSYQCENGFQLKGPSERKCLSSARWSGDEPICEEIQMDEKIKIRYVGCFRDEAQRALPDERDLNVYSLNSGETFISKCIEICKKKGSPYAGLQFRRECNCGDNYNRYGRAQESDCRELCSDGKGKCGGSWRNSVYKTGCVQPDHPENGKGIPRLDYKSGDDADYSCNDNFKLKGKRQVCSGLDWSGEVPKCKEIRTCPKKFTNSKLYITAEKYTPGSYGIFRCKDGFELEGDSRASCHRNLTWSGRRTCRESCRLPVFGSSIRHDSTFEVKCPRTGTLNKIYRCNNGELVAIRVFGCQQDCDKPSSIANGKVTFKGSVAEIQCGRQFKIYGNNKLTCRNGNWSEEWPKCISKRTCISDFSQPLSTVTKLVRHLNPQIFVCASGYQIQGSAVLLCKNGRFPATLPTC
eukprot:gene10608-19347_t